MKKLAVLVLCGPGVGEAQLPLSDFYQRTVEALAGLPVEMTMLLSVNPGPGEDFCRKFAGTRSNVQVYLPPVTAGKANTVTDTGAGRYVFGLYHCAVEMNTDLVLEIDAEGAHNPAQATPFVAGLLDGKQAVLSTRFAQGGRDYYPLQRRMSSMSVTLASNLTLGLGRWVTDMASGFESFRSDLLKQVFAVRPPEDWITMQTTTAFIQTELRSYVLWLLLATKGKSAARSAVGTLPITYGAEKKGREFPASVGTKALKAFLQLRASRTRFISEAAHSSKL